MSNVVKYWHIESERIGMTWTPMEPQRHVTGTFRKVKSEVQLGQKDRISAKAEKAEVASILVYPKLSIAKVHLASTSSYSSSA
eukprot:scaffold7074_cov256-Pinguiococcus_pyrenoidosus.AAC.8